MFDVIEDPEVFCENCYAKISGYYRECPVCGKNWMERPGTQGLKDAVERERIPEDFCRYIVKICENG